MESPVASSMQIFFYVKSKFTKSEFQFPLLAVSHKDR